VGPLLGESRFDVATRVHQSFGTFHRDATRHGINHLIVVCHGTTMRAFVMMWMHYPVSWFEAEHNPPNCAARLLSDDADVGLIYPSTHRT
jgi:2,3-bisphosphoglycerate-dependent phosphoglycerate mutase